MNTLTAQIKKDLKTHTMGHTIHELDQVSSTNDWALTKANQGAEEGTVVIAAEQSAGKGRMGRHWFSPRGHNLYMSIILRPEIKANQLSRLTLVAGAAVSEALGQLTQKEIFLKWPNDLIFNDRKIGGILSEASVTGTQTTSVIIGIGINIDTNDFPEELHPVAGSLSDILEETVERSQVAAFILNYFESWYDQFMNGTWNNVVQWYDSHHILKDCLVELTSGEKSYRGLVQGIDDEGGLILKLDSGETRHFQEGDAERISHAARD